MRVSAREPAIDLLAEARLLLLCARFAFAPAAERGVRRLIAAGVDWDRLIALAVSHGLVPVLCRRLSDLDPSPVPKDVFVRLWSLNVSNAKRCRALAVELLELLRLFEENGIAALPFKGPTLADLLYGDVSLREYADLDILVPAPDLLRARDLVEMKGYESDYPLRPRQDHKPPADSMHHSLAHRHRESGLMIELHWSTDCRLLALPGIDEAWWEMRPVMEFQGISVRALTPEEYLYLLCMHGTRHHWTIFGYIRDVAGIVGRHPGLDWRRVLDMADGQGTRRILLLGVETAHLLLEAPLPDAVKLLIAADPAITAMAARVVRRFEVTSDPAGSTGEKLAFELAWFRFWPRWLGYVLGRSLRPNMADWSRWDLPRALSFLYYPLHIGRLFSKYGVRPDRKYING